MAGVERVRDQVEEWLAANWDAERPLLEWRSLLADSGWGAPAWPAECFGKGLDAAGVAQASAAFAAVGAVGPPIGSGMTLAAPTILEHGSDELKRRLLRGILTGEDSWCQLFSEPGNGSDLAGLTTKAERDGDEWVVSGQKVWTTGARKAAFGMLLARTDWDAPKHRGITYFALPMRQDGVEVRPLRQMNGYASFNEVFLTEARVPHANVIGDVGDGWKAALTTLLHERGLAPRAGGGHGGRGAPSGRTAREAAEEAAAYNQTYVWYPQRAGRPDLVVGRAQESGRADDPIVRQQVAALLAFERASRWTAQRGRHGSLGKLAGSEIARRSAAVHSALSGPHAMLADGGVVAEILVSVPGASIAGGTDEIQHNIIGERVLGLPREPAVDVDVPFREVRRN